VSTRRKEPEDLKYVPTTNTGLWLDKYIEKQDDPKSKNDFIKQVARIAMPKAYECWFKRWQNTLEQYGIQGREIKTLGRLAVGLSGESVLETSVALHHTYGVPYIPGTSLKGLAAAFARKFLGDDWKEDSDSKAYQIVFGDAENAGYVEFFDAMPLLGNSFLEQDIITVHHKDYYEEKKGSSPTDWDEPVPIPFLSVTGSFLLALGGPTDWVNAAFEILALALQEMGVGAKTSSGYGRMKLSAKSTVSNLCRE